MKFQIPLSELEFSFVRSSGPGGQNVNKVNSKAVLRWNILKSTTISAFNRVHLLQKLSNKLTQEGELIISSDVYRDQGRNREECIQKLNQMVEEALKVQKVRRDTKPTWSSQKRNEVSKKKNSDKKRLRKVSYD